MFQKGKSRMCLSITIVSKDGIEKTTYYDMADAIDISLFPEPAVDLNEGQDRADLQRQASVNEASVSLA